jgi:hypothetical protein
MPVPRLNLATVGRDENEEPPLLARADNAPLQPQGSAEAGGYSDDGYSSEGSAVASLPAALRALEAFSLLFSQIDCPLADGFFYVSGDASAFGPQHLLAFCEQYLKSALGQEEVLDVFRSMDADGDGSVSSKDWAAYFGCAAAEHGRLHPQPNAAAACTSSPAPDAAAQASVLAAAAASAGVELQEGDISEELLVTLQQLQQELVQGAAHALFLHSASSQHVTSDHASDQRAPASGSIPAP